MLQFNYLIYSALLILVLALPACAKPAMPENYSPINCELQAILNYAALAPSGHNTQVWKVFIPQEQKDSKAQIWRIDLDDSRFLPEIDPQNREAYLSIGCFLETLERAFIAYGYDINIEFLDNASQPNSIALLSFSKKSQAQIADLSLLSKRHSEKGVFLEQALAPELIASLESTNIHIYPKNSSQAEYLTSSTIAAMSVQCADMQKRIELAKWLRFSNSEAQSKKDGLPAEQLGMHGIKKFFYYAFMNRESALKDSFAKQSVDLTSKQASSAAAYAIITGALTKLDLIQTGRIMQSFWLNMTAQNISVQPLTQILEEKPFNEEIMTKLSLNEPVQVIFRLGYVENYGKNNKIRRPAEEFIVFD